MLLLKYIIQTAVPQMPPAVIKDKMREEYLLAQKNRTTMRAKKERRSEPTSINDIPSPGDSTTSTKIENQVVTMELKKSLLHNQSTSETATLRCRKKKHVEKTPQLSPSKNPISLPPRNFVRDKLLDAAPLSSTNKLFISSTKSQRGVDENQIYRNISYTSSPLIPHGSVQEKVKKFNAASSRENENLSSHLSWNRQNNSEEERSSSKYNHFKSNKSRSPTKGKRSRRKNKKLGKKNHSDRSLSSTPKKIPSQLSFVKSPPVQFVNSNQYSTNKIKTDAKLSSLKLGSYHLMEPNQNSSKKKKFMPETTALQQRTDDNSTSSETKAVLSAVLNAEQQKGDVDLFVDDLKSAQSSLFGQQIDVDERSNVTKKWDEPLEKISNWYSDDDGNRSDAFESNLEEGVKAKRINGARRRRSVKEL